MRQTQNKVKTANPTARRSLCLWPGIVIVALQWLIRFIVPRVFPGDFTLTLGVFGALAAGLLVMIWWTFFSRAAWSERLGAIGLMIVSILLTFQFIHVSISDGWQGMMYFVYVMPTLSMAFVIWAVVTRNYSDRLRRSTMVAAILLGSGIWLLLRSDGITGEASVNFTWRWKKTAEEILLAQFDKEEFIPAPAAVSIDSSADWPGFRGSERNAVVRGLRIKTDWTRSIPVELWRRPVGPGCSSCAIRGGLLYTQEQRGRDEIVSCYDLSSGKPIWRHADDVRFWDSHVGPGPRATPTLHQGRVFTMGATGILNVLDARNGHLFWSRNTADETGTKDSGWGFTGSPLVVDSLVIVAATGKLAAYDVNSGDPRWYGPDAGDSYSSPHLITFNGIPHIVLLSGKGVTAVSPSDGKVLWQHDWQRDARIVQPALTDDNNDLLISAGARKGVRRLSIKEGTPGWATETVWTSTMLRPDFNDFVVHKGHAYGFNGPNLACIDIREGKRRWRGQKFGGQVILLADQDLLLVTTEEGELALIEANPEQYHELSRIKAVKGKTWNHPALAGDILVIRSTEEMVAFRLPLLEG